MIAMRPNERGSFELPSKLPSKLPTAASSAIGSAVDVDRAARSKKPLDQVVA